MKSIKNKKSNNKKTKKVNKSKKLYNNIKGGGNNGLQHKPLRTKIYHYDDEDIESFSCRNRIDRINTGFFLEKLCENNIVFWQNYNKYQTIVTKMGVRDNDGKTYYNISDGVISFKIALDLYKPENDYDIWIAYSKNNTNINTNTNLDKFIFNFEDDREFANLGGYNRDFKGINKNYDDIIITVTMCINRNSPITSHVGISKNYLYFGWYENFTSPKNISMYLHSFMAKVCNYIYPDNQQKIYMVTKPVKLMRNIMDKSLQTYANNKKININDIIIIGNNLERHRLKTNNKAHKQYLENIQNIHSFETSLDYIRPPLEKGDLSISPLHNIGDTWSITYKGKTIQFDKPHWFKHRDLSNRISTTIIDIEHLGNLYFADYWLNK
jgi:hypothetical protein